MAYKQIAFGLWLSTCFLAICTGILLGRVYALSHQPKIISPCPRIMHYIHKKDSVTITPAPKVVFNGIASYYSIVGCVGCSKNFTMANGQMLDDTALTIAFNKAPLNTKVQITHNGKTIIATVTDRGGFESLGRIADLSVAVKEALACNDLCQVTISIL